MNPNEREHFEELCASYVLDALEANEAAQLERLLQQVGPEDVAFFEAMQEVALLLPVSSEPVAPSIEVRQRLLEEVRRRKHGHASASSSLNSLGAVVAWWQSLTLAWSATAVFFLVGAGASFFAWNNTQVIKSLQGKVDGLQKQTQQLSASVVKWKGQNKKNLNKLKVQKRRIFALRNELERKTKLARLLASRTVELVRMKTSRSRKLRAYRQGHGKLLWDPVANKALLQLANLPRYKDKDYQLWMLDPGSKLPRKAGVYAYEGDKYNFFEASVPIPRRKRRLRFAISLEPKGGSPKATPTGPIVMLTKKISL